jgi:hypothetical protein
MLRKRKAQPTVPAEAAAHLPQAPASPVNVVVVVEPRRGRRLGRKADAEREDDGHPFVKTVLGVAVAKRLMRRRKRPLSKRVTKAVRKGRRRVRKTVRKVRRAIR